jgi:hypothetical protein
VCASVSLCVVTDDLGNLLTSTDPSSGARAWKRAHIDKTHLGNDLIGVSCPTRRLCVVVDNAGNVLSSTDPTGGKRAWKLVHLHLIKSSAGNALSCPSVSRCVVADGQKLASTTHPTGGARAWKLTTIDPGNELTSVSCPSARLCIAGDADGNMLVGRRPKHTHPHEHRPRPNS